MDVAGSAPALAVLEWRARKARRGLQRPRHRTDHQRPVLALLGALHLRHLVAGQHHRARHGGARRQELVFPDGGLRLRPYAAGLGHRGGQGQWRRRAGRGAPSAGLVGLRLLSAAGPGQPRAGHRAGQRGRRHGQRDQGGQRIRADPRRPENGRPAAVHQRHPRHRPGSRRRPDADRGLLLGPERADPRLVQALLRQTWQNAQHEPGGHVFLGHALPEGGAGRRHRRRRRGHETDEGHAHQRLLRHQRPHPRGRPHGA